LNRVFSDVENDILDLFAIIDHLDNIKPIFDKVRNGPITPDLFDQGISRILTRNYRTSLNKNTQTRPAVSCSA
jgi:hypothetical protein